MAILEHICQSSFKYKILKAKLACLWSISSLVWCVCVGAVLDVTTWGDSLQWNTLLQVDVLKWVLSMTFSVNACTFDSLMNVFC